MLPTQPSNLALVASVALGTVPGIQWVFNLCFMEERASEKEGRGGRERREVYLSAWKGPAPQRELLLQNAAAFAHSFKNPLEAKRAHLPWFQGTGQLHPFLTMNFLCLSPQNGEISPLLGLDFFPRKERERISSLIQTENDRFHLQVGKDLNCDSAPSLALSRAGCDALLPGPIILLSLGLTLT